MAAAAEAPPASGSSAVVPHMVSSIRLLHPPSSSSNTTPHPIVILTLNGRKVVFNAPEGTVRTLSSRKTNLIGARGPTHIYVQDATLAASGLPGILMTLGDAASKEEIHLHGPPHTAYSLATARFCAKRVGRQLRVHEVPSSATTSGAASSTIWPAAKSKPQEEIVRPLLSWSAAASTSSSAPDVEMAAASSSEASSSSSSNGSRKRRRSSDVPQSLQGAAPTSNAEYDANAYASSKHASSSSTSPNFYSRFKALETAQDMFKAGKSVNAHGHLDDPSAVRGSPSAAWIQKRLAPPSLTPPQHVALSYAITLPTLSGKMDPQKALLEGVKAGPNFGKLQLGQSVTVQRPVGWQGWSEEEKMKWAKGGKGGKKKGQQQQQQPQEPAPPEPQLEDVVVEPSSCVAPPVPGPVVLLVHLPTPGHIDSFLSHPGNASALHYATHAHQGKVHLIVHTSPLEVLKDERYRSWVATTTSETTQHVLTAKELGANTILYPSSALLLLRLSQLDKDLFRFPPYSLQRDERLVEKVAAGFAASADVSSSQAQQPVWVADRDTTIELQPRMGAPGVTNHAKQASSQDVTFDANAAEGTADYERKMAYLSFDARGRAAEAAEAKTAENGEAASKANGEAKANGNGKPKGKGKSATATKEEELAIARRRQMKQEQRETWLEFTKMADKLRGEVAAEEKQATTSSSSSGVVRNAAWEGIRVTTLGTGSAAPTKYRTVSATLIELPGRLLPSNTSDPVYVLLDAGENTLGQLAQRFGRGPALDKVLKGLRLVFVSHIHADHCLGVAGILRARRALEKTSGEGSKLDPLFLISNFYTRRSLAEWNALEDIGLRDPDVEPDVLEEEDTGSVILLESEHLDYQNGVARLGSDDSAYIQHLEAGFRPGFDRWLGHLRREVLSQRPFAGLDEDDLIAEEPEIAAAVRRLAEERSSAMRHGRGKGDGLEPDFAKSARSLYEGVKRRERDLTRAGWGKLRALLGEGSEVSTVEVDHRARHCYGIVVRLAPQTGSTGGSGFSFSYSGDTRPTPHLESAAKGVDLYIHEATMQEEEAHEAYSRGHSTIRGAIESATRAEAKVVLLTHFSQRYPKMARMNLDSGKVEEGEEGKKRRPTVAFGMDLLDVGMNDLWKMERYLPAMEVLFRANEAEEEEGEDGEEEGEGKGKTD